MSNQFLHMQKLAGLITESEYKVKLTEAENIVSKIDQNLDKVEALPAVQQAAEKIMNNPELLKQFQQGLAKMGINMDLIKEGEDISTSDLSKIVSAVQSQVNQIQEFEGDTSQDELTSFGIRQREAELKNIDDRGGAILRGIFGTPILVGILSKVTGAGLYTALGLAALGAVPSLLVTMAVGGLIGGVVGAIAHKKRQAGNKLNESSLRNKIKEIIHSSLGEAKKKKKDVAPQEDVDINVDAEEAPMPDETSTEDALAPTDMSGGSEVDIDPKVKSIQDYLQKAYANAKSLGDEKLMTQIGNTITMVVRNQVLGGQAVAESLNEMEDTYSQDEVTNDILNDGIGNKGRGDVFFEAWHLATNSELTDEEAWEIYSKGNVNIK